MTGSGLTMTLVMLAIFAVMVGVAATYPEDARFMPFVVGIPALALCALQLALDLWTRRHPAAPTDALSAIEAAEQRASRLLGHEVRLDAPRGRPAPEVRADPTALVRREFIVWGYFLGLIGAILLFGFRISVPLFLIVFLRLFAKAGWVFTLGLSIAASVVALVLFEKVLGMTLHSGFVTDYLLGLFGG